MSGEPHLEVAFKHWMGTLALSVSFRAGAPWTVLFGASGSGKSTILRVVAGLERPKLGRVAISGQVVMDSAAGVWVPAHRRPMRWDAQRAFLPPGKTVGWNLAMGMGHTKRGWSSAELERAIDHFKLGDLVEKLPHELSGGERQRIAVVRAAVGARGRLLLLDEPFTGLDAAVRDQLIEDLRAWVGETPVVSVTHDVGEAFLLGAEVVRVSEGRVVGQGAVEEVLGEERRRLVGILVS